MPLRNLVAGENRSEQTSLNKIFGKCQKLVFKNEAHNCENFIFQSQYEDGKTGFWFLSKDNGRNLEAFTFSGRIQDQILLEGSETKQPIKLIHSVSNNMPAVKTLAEGFCLYGNLLSGVAKIECKAIDYDRNIFTGIFLTDGRPPQDAK